VRKLKSAALAALAFALFAVLAGPAAAHDRNGDRIPDRWEKRHHLSLKVKQGKRDQDGDGLRNRAEWKAGFDPRDDDSDDDGTEDGDENAGTILSFADGVLKITVFGQSDPLVGLVDDSTEIECEHATATKSDEGPSESGDDEPGDDHGDDGPGHDAGDDHGDDDQGEDEDEDDDRFDEQPCGTDQLTAGTKVKEAELRLVGGKAVFEELELHP
jgi:hypothetical protein